MSDTESERNDTQRRIDEEGVKDKPVDVPWTDDEGEPEPETIHEPHAGEEGQDIV